MVLRNSKTNSWDIVSPPSKWSDVSSQSTLPSVLAMKPSRLDAVGMVTRDFALSMVTALRWLKWTRPRHVPARPRNNLTQIFKRWVLELLVELARRAGDENPAGDVALAVFDTLYDAGGLAAFGAVGALGCVHYFLAVCGLSNLGHIFSENLFYTRSAETVFGRPPLFPLVIPRARSARGICCL